MQLVREAVALAKALPAAKWHATAVDASSPDSVADYSHTIKLLVEYSGLNEGRTAIVLDAQTRPAESPLSDLADLLRQPKIDSLLLMWQRLFSDSRYSEWLWSQYRPYFTSNALLEVEKRFAPTNQIHTQFQALRAVLNKITFQSS